MLDALRSMFAGKPEKPNNLALMTQDEHRAFTRSDRRVTDHTPPQEAIDWKAKYDRAHKRELAAIRERDSVKSELREARRQSAYLAEKLTDANIALRKIANSEAKAGSAVKLANIARAELALPLRTKAKAQSPQPTPAAAE